MKDLSNLRISLWQGFHQFRLLPFRTERINATTQALKWWIQKKLYHGVWFCKSLVNRNTNMMQMWFETAAENQPSAEKKPSSMSSSFIACGSYSIYVFILLLQLKFANKHVFLFQPMGVTSQISPGKPTQNHPAVKPWTPSRKMTSWQNPSSQKGLAVPKKCCWDDDLVILLLMSIGS